MPAPVVRLPDGFPETRDILAELDRAEIVRRIWDRDHTVWADEPEEITNRLGWLGAPATGQAAVPAIQDLLASVQSDGLDQVLLLGMGGSSLAPELFARSFSDADGLDLRVLDSTVPADVRAALDWADPERTLFVVASKSGTTVETLSFMNTFYRRAVKALGSESAAGAHFVAITDPETPLSSANRDHGFRKVFRADPDVGGRYSALTHFGLVPAGLVGVDLNGLLSRAAGARRACQPETTINDNPGAVLGAGLGGLWRSGRNKLTFLGGSAVPGFADWCEQLIAESTGKSGVGIVPVVAEPGVDPSAYRQDRVFVALDVGDDRPADGPSPDDLVAAGHPVIRVSADDRLDLGGLFFVWEFATAVAGHVMGIQPFDQPNVESAKRRAKDMMTRYADTGTLELPEPDLVTDGIAFTGAVPSGAASVDAVLSALIAGADDTDYLAIQAFLPTTPDIQAALGSLREALAHTGLAATLGFGPRYLHSTGQLHKGDGGNGRFLMLLADDETDIEIPDRPEDDAASASYGVLKSAQALGDFQALQDEGRHAVLAHLGVDAVAALETLTDSAAAVVGAAAEANE